MNAMQRMLICVGIMFPAARVDAADPAVLAGWLTAEVRAGRSFPGDGLPG